MPILNLQRRLVEVGRIRIGQVVPTSNGKTRPAKLEKFRFTSIDRTLLDRVAAAYGGTVQPWTPANGGASQWEVLTDASSVQVIVPPQSLTQWMELWSGGGAARRCDGETEILSDSPCMCAAADDMICKPTTRLSVLLRDIEGLGAWRLESKGWNAAAGLPGMAELLAKAGGYIQARLYLKPVRQVTGGQTRDFMVPVLAVDNRTPGQLLAGDGAVAPAAIGQGARPAIEAAPPAAVEPDWHALIAAATTREELLGIRADGIEAGLTGQRATALDAALAARGKEIAAASPEPDDDSDEAKDRLWAEITATTRFDTTADLERDFWTATGKSPETATAGLMRAYLRGKAEAPVPA